MCNWVQCGRAARTTAETKRRISDWFRQWRSPLRKFLLGKAGVATPEVDAVAQEVFLRLMRYEKAELIERRMRGGRAARRHACRALAVLCLRAHWR